MLCLDCIILYSISLSDSSRYSLSHLSYTYLMVNLTLQTEAKKEKLQLCSTHQFNCGYCVAIQELNKMHMTYQKTIIDRKLQKE